MTTDAKTVHEVTVLPYMPRELRAAFPAVVQIHVVQNDASAQVVQFRYGPTGDAHELDVDVSLAPGTLTESTPDFIAAVLLQRPDLGAERIMGSQVSDDAMDEAKAALAAWGDD